MRLNQTNINIIKRLLIGRSNRPLKTILDRTAAADLAGLFTSFREREQLLLLDALILIRKAAEVLSKMPEDQALRLIVLLTEAQVSSLLTECAEDDAAWLIDLFEEEDDRNRLLRLLPKNRRNRLLQLLSYPEDSAGRMMDTQPFSIPDHLTAQEAIDYIRDSAKKDENSFYYMYTVNEENVLTGVLSLRALTSSAAQIPLSQMVKREVVTVAPETPESEVARLVGKYDFVAIPVVDAQKRLLGVITVDDILDLIQDQATADAYATAGLQEDDRVYSSLKQSLRFRLPWMVLNLGLSLMASSVVNLFEETLSTLILLAVFNNVVAGMGGNTAIQTLTVVTRGIATGDFGFTTTGKVILKEVFVGLSLGTFTGLLAGGVIYFWKGSAIVALAIGSALILNSLVAAAAGGSIPLLLRRFKLDPAVGSGVLVTTFTDVFGFFSFLGIATLALKIFGATL